VGLTVFHLSLLGNGSVNMFTRQRGIVGGVVFYAVLVASKKSRQLVLLRTSCLYGDVKVNLNVFSFRH
jgi:hypothetical protein